MTKNKLIGLKHPAVSETPKPDAEPARLFVVQKHAAHRAGLHWDFRLEHNGVLWSWAVPKGPSLDPADKRMAIHVEDHPVEYADFEGTIPAGEYGGGDVETWDRGTWRPLGDPDEGMRKGDLKFVLSGQRLNGRFTLARLHQRDRHRQEAWFLIKGHDEAARPGVSALGMGGTRDVEAATPLRAEPLPLPATVHASKAAPDSIVVARAPRQARLRIGDIELTHPDRPLWPGIRKRDLAEYWLAVADVALPGLAHRPLSIVRCPDGIEGEHFFQKNGHGHLPPAIREGSVSGSPFVAIDDVNGLIALAQVSAIELHPWGSSEADPLHPDRLVFDLDPGEGVAFTDLISAARDVRERLKRLGLISFCRTTGGKGLHVVVPLTPSADWDTAKRFCRAFAELMGQEEPKRFLAHLKIADRRGRILIDWLRNGMGATAVSSFCPRARPGATVATPLAWDEVKADLDPAAFTVLTLPGRLKRSGDPWRGFAEVDQHLPDAHPAPVARKTGAIRRTGPTRKTGAKSAATAKPNAPRISSIVHAAKPKPRRD